MTSYRTAPQKIVDRVLYGRPKIGPCVEPDGTPYCSERCPGHDGKRCESLGVRAPEGGACPPAASLLVSEILRRDVEAGSVPRPSIGCEEACAEDEFLRNLKILDDVVQAARRACHYEIDRADVDAIAWAVAQIREEEERRA